MIPVREILRVLEGIIELEKKIAKLIEEEKDKNRRKKLAKAIKDRDLDSVRRMLFDDF